MIKSSEQMYEGAMRQMSEHLEKANIDLTEATIYMCGDGAVCVGRFNEETQDEEEFFRNVVNMFVDCCTEDALHYAKKRIEEVLAEL